MSNRFIEYKLEQKSIDLTGPTINTRKLPKRKRKFYMAVSPNNLVNWFEIVSLKAILGLYLWNNINNFFKIKNLLALTIFSNRIYMD